MIIASDEGRNKNDAVHAAVLLMIPHSKHGAAQLSHYSDWATDWTIRGSNPDQQEIFLHSKASDKFWGAHSLLFNGYRGTSKE